VTRAACFLVLPWLPAVALAALLDPGPIPVFRDRIVVVVLAGLLAALLSSVLALRAGRGAVVAALYGTTTAVLCVGTVALVIALVLIFGESED
jgi:hypothetical protein